jgi:polyhydroxyalkanoate synthesis regulator phasin
MNEKGSDRKDVQSSFSERIEQLFQQLQKRRAEVDSLTEQIQHLRDRESRQSTDQQ